MKEKNVKAKAPNKKVLGLTTKIFIALLAGAILGIVLCYLVPDSSFKKDVIVEGVLYVIGQGFIRLMKMLVVPLVFCSLVCGSMAIGDTKKLGTVGVRTLAFYLATTALAVCVALGVGNLINPWKQRHSLIRSSTSFRTTRSILWRAEACFRLSYLP